MIKFNNKSKPKTKEGNAKKQNTFDRVNTFYEDRESTLNELINSVISHDEFVLINHVLKEYNKEWKKQSKI